MDAAEFCDWQAYFQIEPWGISGMELLFAQLCHVTNNGSERLKPARMDEFMLLTRHAKKLTEQPRNQNQMMEQFLAKSKLSELSLVNLHGR